MNFKNVILKKQAQLALQMIHSARAAGCDLELRFPHQDGILWLTTSCHMSGQIFVKNEKVSGPSESTTFPNAATFAAHFEV